MSDIDQASIRATAALHLCFALPIAYAAQRTEVALHSQHGTPPPRRAPVAPASERELVDHCIELCRARAELLSCDTPARVDACIVIDTALVLVQSVINVGVAVQEIAIDRLSPHEIPRSMVGTVGCHIAALLNHLPRRSWPALTAALTAWTEAIGVVLKESGMKERYEVRGQVRKNPDFFGVAPLSIDRDAWKRVFSS